MNEYEANKLLDNLLSALYKKAKTDFKIFCQLYYNEVSAGHQLENTFHTNLLITLCQLKADRKLKHKNLNIAIPPGHTKTTICNVLYTAWLFSISPNLRIIYGTNNQPEANDRNKKVIELMESETYKKYNSHFHLSSNAITWFQTNQKGGRRAITTNIDKKLTGGDADLLLIDDANDLNGRTLGFENVLNWFYKKAYTRLRGTAIDMGFINIQQMTGIDCLANKLKEREDTFTLILRAEEDDDIEIKIPLINDEYYTIIRPKGYLWQKKIKDYEYIKNEKRDIWETQYQQNPIDSTDAIFKREWFIFDKTEGIEYEQIYFSIDCGINPKKGSDPTAILVIGIKNNKFYILDAIVDTQYSNLSKLGDILLHLYNQWKKYNVRGIFIEAKVSGSSFITLMNELQHPLAKLITPIIPKESKRVRLEQAIGLLRTHLQNKAIILPEENVGWRNNFINELVYFTGRDGQKDDQVDALSQFINEYYKNYLRFDANQPALQIFNNNINFEY